MLSYAVWKQSRIVTVMAIGLAFYGTVINSDAWTLTVFLIPSFTPHSQIGWISIGMGTFWLLIAAAIHFAPLTQGKRTQNKLTPHPDPALAIIFGYQGILIVSLGILLVATGYTRFLILSVEACVLLAGACYFGGKWARLASLLTFFCALYTATPCAATSAVISSATLTAPPAWPSYAALALICAVYTMLVRRDQELSENFRATLPKLPAAIFWSVLAWGVFGQYPSNIDILGLWITVTGVMLAYFLTKRPWWLADIAQFSIIPAIGAGFWLINEAHFISLPESILPIAGAASFWFMAPRLTQAWAQAWIQTGPHPQKSDPSKSDPSSSSDSTSFSNSPPSNNTTLEWIFGLLMRWMLAMALDAHLSPPTQWMWLGGTLAILGHGIAHITGRKSIGIPAVAFHLLAVAGLVHNLFNPTSEWLIWMPLLGLLIHLALADFLWPVLNQKTMRRLLSLVLLVSVALHATAKLDLSKVTRPRPEGVRHRKLPASELSSHGCKSG